MPNNNSNSWMEPPLNYDVGSPARAFQKILKEAYTNPNTLRERCEMAKVAVGEINFAVAPNLLPKKVIDEAARNGRVPQLIAEVLSDMAVAAFHTKLIALLNDSELAKVSTHVEGTERSFAKRSLLLPVAVLNAEATPRGALEKPVHEEAGFEDPERWSFLLSQSTARVCRVEIDGIGEGTGWLVAPDLVLTAYHVVRPVEDTPEKIQVRFDYRHVWDGNAERTLDPGWSVDLSEKPILATSPHESIAIEFSEQGPVHAGQEGIETTLDFALLRLASPVGSMGLGRDGTGEQIRGHFALPDEAREFLEGEPLLILGHPQLSAKWKTEGVKDSFYDDREAGPLKLTIASPSEARLSPSGTRVRYRVNSNGGNSGSPVLDRDYLPVALHHAGTLHPGAWAADGPWKDGFNQGIPLALVVARLRRVLDEKVLLELGLESPAE